MIIYRLIGLTLMVILGLLPCLAQAQININADLNIIATDSLNNNDVLVGDMANAHQFEYQYAHQYDHQLNFSSTFTDMEDSTVYIPVGNVALQNVNTGISTGDSAGAVGGVSNVSQVNLTNSVVAGMAGGSSNMGGVSQNQSTVNMATAFSR